MKIHLHKEMDRLKKQLFHLSSLVEDNLKLAIQAAHEGDTALAEKVRERDREIDLKEVELEEECLKILALHQPVATDLRFLISVLKVNNDLERIGDLAVAIGKAAQSVSESAPPVVTENLNTLGEKARTMLRLSLEALMDMDKAKARLVLASDDEVDKAYHELLQVLLEEMARNPERIKVIYTWLRAAKSIERVADHTTNLAEDVIYSVEGEIVRHGLG
jgi:phosphate transport system protein